MLSVQVTITHLCPSLLPIISSKMGADAFIEPIIVATILIGGVYVNRRSTSLKDGYRSPSSESLLPNMEPQWRERKVFGRTVRCRNTAVWRDTKISRFIARYPFAVEVWYWLLVYWVRILSVSMSVYWSLTGRYQTYQIGRAFTALTLQADLTPIARLHALSLISLEKRLGLFIELDVQHWFLPRPVLLKIINCMYSFIHIPGTITFLACLYHYAPRPLFEARRRTLAICNLIAFVIFTSWPCMPPRLLPEEDGFGFVDTVHTGKVASVWTSNRFCQQL